MVLQQKIISIKLTDRYTMSRIKMAVEISNQYLNPLSVNIYFIMCDLMVRHSNDDA